MGHNFGLHRAIARLAAGIAEGKVAKQKSRDATFFNDVARRADDDSGDSVLFQMPRDQTHGLVTDRSERNKESDIHSIQKAACKNLGRIVFHCSTLAVVRGHAVESIGQ